jgi:RTX calcium-binding nonapeptide repeat (4 copies)
VVADNNALAPDAGSDGALIKVNPRTGEQRVFVDGTAPGALIDEPDGLTFAPQGFLAVADFEAGEGQEGALIRVNPRTGAETLIADNSTSSADLFLEPVNVGVARSGAPIALEYAGPGASDPGLIRIALRTGQQTALSLGGAFSAPYGLTVLPNNRLIVADEDAFAGSGGGLIAVNPRTGAQRPISSNAISGPDLFDEPSGVVREPRGSYAVVDWHAFAGNDGGVIRVNPRTGAQRTLASNERPGPDLFGDPFDIVVVPPRCAGQFATIYGGPRRDVLKGTRFPDVIAGLAGNDRILGLKGNDRLCGGRGRDRLRGGAGRDRLRGGPGRDIQRP